MDFFFPRVWNFWDTKDSKVLAVKKVGGFLNFQPGISKLKRIKIRWCFHPTIKKSFPRSWKVQNELWVLWLCGVLSFPTKKLLDLWGMESPLPIRSFFAMFFFLTPQKLTSLWGPYPCYTGSGRVYSSKLMILHVMNLLSRKDPTPRKKGTKKQIQEIQVHGSNLYLILFALLKRTWLKKKLIHPFPHFAPWEDVAVPAPKARYALAMWLKDQGWYNNSFPKNLLDTWVYPKRLTRIPRIQPTWGIDFSRVYGGVYN